MIRYEKNKLDKLRLGVIKKDISSKKYKKYNDEVYEKKYLRRDIMTRYKKKIYN